MSHIRWIFSTFAFPSYYFIPFPSAEELLLRPSGRPFTISVEGSVGAGKSTLLKYFEKVLIISHISEYNTIVLVKKTFTI